MTKRKGHIFVLLAFLIVAGMIVSPVCAASYTLTGFQEINVFDVQKDTFDNVRNITFDRSNDDKAITLIHFKAPMDHTVDFTIWYGAGNSVSGSAATAWNTSLLPLHTTTSTITFDGVTKEYSYLDTNPEFDYFLSGYAKDNEANTTGLIVYNAGYGSFDNELAVYKAVPNIAANLIYKVEITCDVEFDADVSYGTASEVAKSVSKNIVDIGWEWINLAITLGASVLAFLVGDPAFSGGVYWWLKFFFIDNLLLVIVMYFSVTMAYSAMTSRGNVFKFYKNFIKYQKGLFQFIISLWESFVNILATFRGIFRL
jgi:hypothetical protein